VLLEVIGQILAAVETLLQLGVGDVARHHQRSGQREARGHRMPPQLRQHLAHGLAQVDLHHAAAQLALGHLGQEAGGVGLELLQVNAVGGDLAQHLPVGGARHPQAHRARGAVAGQADHPHVVGEVLAAELRADAGLPAELEHLGLQLDVAEGAAVLVAGGGQAVEVAGAGELDRLQGELRRHAAHHQRQVVGRAGRGAQRADLVGHELQQRVGVQEGLGLLVEVRLVGRAAALGQEEELVLAAGVA
jgi:hypothetical protein